jgi:hypothetical protein
VERYSRPRGDFPQFGGRKITELALYSPQIVEQQCLTRFTPSMIP